MLNPCDPSPRPILVAEDLDDDYDTVVEAARRVNLPNALVRARTLAETRVLLGEEQRPPFGFVLLDVNLPDGPGRELVQAIRSDGRLRNTPIVVFSTSDNPRDLRELYAAGANAYHVKALRYDANLEQLSHIFGYWLRSVCLDDSTTP